MKIQIIEKGGKTFIKGFFLGFIPVYFDDYPCRWSLFKDDIHRSRAEELVERWIARKKEQDAFKASPTKVILTTFI